VRQCGVTAVKDAGEVRIDDAAPLVDGHRRDVAHDGQARVVDQNVESAKAIHSNADESLGLCGIAHVGANGHHAQRIAVAGRERCVRGVEPCLVGAADDDVSAGVGERARNRQTDASRATGDDRALAVQ